MDFLNIQRNLLISETHWKLNFLNYRKLRLKKYVSKLIECDNKF